MFSSVKCDQLFSCLTKHLPIKHNLGEFFTGTVLEFDSDLAGSSKWIVQKMFPVGV